MAANRALGRDIHIYDANDPITVLGGFIRSNDITNANLYAMLEVFLFFDGNYHLQRENGTDVQRDEQALQAGNYYIITTGTRFLLATGQAVNFIQALFLLAMKFLCFVRSQ
jgi:hypothetical protein